MKILDAKTGRYHMLYRDDEGNLLLIAVPEGEQTKIDGSVVVFRGDKNI